MITKNDLLESMIHEANVCKHLHGKIPPDGFDFRPTPGQRSTLELLRYLSLVGIAATRSIIEGSWDVWGAYAEAARQMAPEDFPGAMDRQMEELRALFARFSDEEFATRRVQLPWRDDVTLEHAVFDTVYKWFVGYKMQLFLYLKLMGRAELGTLNCWRGSDPISRPEPVEPAVAG
ncbi:MAG TPA: hypothetical protein VHI13_04890 [Candidatus Kapabacteria bacterium]|nr:hypothetical protein [Candidatus Kapabacteria bacterium]